MYFRIELSARLRQCVECGKIHAKKAKALQHLIGIGNAGKTRDILLTHECPKSTIKQGTFRHDNGCPHGKMCIEDRKPVDVMKRQVGYSTLRPIDMQIFDDGFCIGAKVLIALTHELRTARRAGCRHEKGKIIMERKGILFPQIQKYILLPMQDFASCTKLCHAFCRNPYIGRTICRSKRHKQFCVEFCIHHHGYDPMLKKADIACNRSR